VVVDARQGKPSVVLIQVEENSVILTPLGSLIRITPTKPSAAKTLDSKDSRGTRFALSLIAFGANKFSVCQRAVLDVLSGNI
jgi:hypothetical protein